MDSNDALNAGLDKAFETAKKHQGNATLEFEGGVCVITLKNGDRTEQIELKNGDAKVFFYPKSNSAYSSTPKNVRMREHYLITFSEGSITFNGRNRTPQISYKPLVRNGSRW